jgi:DNA-binding transcriptional LysR family regulator
MESVLQRWQNLHMTDLNEIAVFVSVAQLGSFTGAARALSMPVSTVSRRIADLEQQLGVTLIQRTTRKLTLTAQGRDYFDQCSEPLAHLYDAERVLTHSQRQPEGILRISVPVILGDPVFLGFLSDFLRNHPRIRLDLFITNQMLDLVAESIDVALRIGELKSSSIVARKLGTTVRYVVAAPAYLGDRARPREPAELAEHACVLLNAVNNEAEWELVNDRHRARVRVIGAAASRDFQSLSFFVGRGHGIGLMPSTYCDSQIENGTLVRLLPKWSSPPVSVHAVYPTRKFLPERMQVFLQALRAWRSPFWVSS